MRSRRARNHLLLLAVQLLVIGLLVSSAAEEEAAGGQDVHDAQDAEEPRLGLSSPAPAPAEARRGETNRCSDLEDMSLFARGSACGPPLTQPCFDFGRCSTTNTSTFGFYVHDANCSLSDSSEMLAADGTAVGEEDGDPHFIGWVFRNAAREAGALAESYEGACVIMHVSRGGRGSHDCALRSPLWNDGVNHVMVDFGDTGRESRPEVVDSFAMDASSNTHSCVYRSGYDVSLPLAPEKYYPDLATIAPLDRAFFLTFKGTVYLGGHGSEERLSVVPLNDEEHGVVMSVHCFEVHGEHLLPENLEYCQSLRDRYDNFGYSDLMETTFALVPSGRSPGTYRLAEAMGAGAIPVIVARDYVPPFRERIDWPSFSFTFAPDQVGPYMMDVLRAVPQAQLEEMQRLSLEAYRRMFGDDDTLEGPSAFGPIAKNLIDIILQRIQHRGRHR